MADNITVTPGTGATIAADECTIDGAAALVQRVKPAFGVAGSAVDVSATNPLPVTITDLMAGEYETVAAGQTAQTIGPTGATGDYLAGVLVIPASTSPGVVTVLDNATSINVFAGGASSLSNLVPFFIPIGAKSVSGAWKVTTGSNVSVFAVGNFT